MDSELRVYAKGKSFEDGVYDLRTLEALISNYRKILDSLIAVHLGKRQADKLIKEQLSYSVKINSGSIELLIEFIVQHKDYAALFALDGGEILSKSIVSLFRDAISLREKASEFLEKGFNVNINISNSFNAFTKIENTNISYDNNSGKIYINDPRILFAAQLTRAPVNNLLGFVDGSSVEYIDINSSTEDFRITPDQRNIIGRHKEELSATLNIVGRLDMVAFSSHKGVIVSDGERFQVSWDEQIRSKMQQLADVEGAVFKVRPIIDHKRLDSEAIGFHVLNCENPQGKLEV